MIDNSMGNATVLSMLLVLLTSASLSADDAQANSFEVVQFDVVSRETQTLFSGSTIGQCQSLAWNSESKRFALSTLETPGGSRDDAVPRLRVCRHDGSEMLDIGRGQLPSWSPRGKRLAFSRQRPDGGVWVVRADGSDAQIIDSWGWAAAWSPKGNRVAYVRKDDGSGRPNLVIYNLVEAQFSVVWPIGECPYDKLFAGLVWSPKGERICVKVRSQQSAETLVSVITADSGIRPIVKTKAALVSDQTPLCWVSEQQVVFGKQDSSQLQLWTIDSENADRSELTRLVDKSGQPILSTVVASDPRPGHFYYVPSK